MPASLVGTFRAMAYNNAWANHRLLAACGPLTQAEFEAPRTSFFHHRGQAHAMLAGTTAKPPQLDEFFSAGEAPLRAAELTALGWSEATVWDGETCG